MPFQGTASLVHGTASLVKTILRFFFRLLYHQFAFSYDLVSAAVSFNRWNEWVARIVPFIKGKRVLEIGHGPGHLQRILLLRGLVTVGIDESAQMSRLAKHNLRRWISSPLRDHSSSSPDASISQDTYTQINLTRGVAQLLPFSNGSFDTIVATFPTEYITDLETLSEVKRCLSETGRLVTLPVALPRNRFLDWLFRFTHQSPAEALEISQAKIREPFVDAGFRTEVAALDVESGILLIVFATK